MVTMGVRGLLPNEDTVLRSQSILAAILAIVNDDVVDHVDRTKV
jgi:hypothetical protein